MPKYEGGPVRIAGLAENTEILDGFEFENCEIIGPAVIAVLDHNDFINSSFDGDFEALLWEIPHTRQRVVGAIGVKNCRFVGCKFRRIGFAGPAEFIVAFRRGVTSPPESREARK